MQATATASLRLASRQVQARSVVASSLRRGLATAAATHADASVSATTPARKVVPLNLANVEAQWTKLSEQEQAAVHEQLEAIQQKDWKELSLEEKKAAYYVAFGPHGPRAPSGQPGDGYKIIGAVSVLVAAAGLLAYGLRQFAQPTAHTMTKEWQEASNERAKEMKLNPITGITSEGYKGTGFVQSK